MCAVSIGLWDSTHFLSRLPLLLNNLDIITCHFGDGRHQLPPIFDVALFFVHRHCLCRAWPSRHLLPRDAVFDDALRHLQDEKLRHLQDVSHSTKRIDREKKKKNSMRAGPACSRHTEPAPGLTRVAPFGILRAPGTGRRS